MPLLFRKDFVAGDVASFRKTCDSKISEQLQNPNQTNKWLVSANIQTSKLATLSKETKGKKLLVCKSGLAPDKIAAIPQPFKATVDYLPAAGRQIPKITHIARAVCFQHFTDIALNSCTRYLRLRIMLKWYGSRTLGTCYVSNLDFQVF